MVQSMRQSETNLPMSKQRVVIVGGGAAGIFAAITCAEAAADIAVTVLEKSPQFLYRGRWTPVPGHQLLADNY